MAQSSPCFRGLRPCHAEELFDAEAERDQRRRGPDPGQHGSIVGETRAVDRKYSRGIGSYYFFSLLGHCETLLQGLR